jgi:hypothetical protein
MKYNILRYIDTPNGDILTFNAFVKRAIAEKNTLFG